MPKTHMMSNTRFYSIWEHIKGRCNNKNSTKYYMYGARGIKVCERWNKFENFRDDMYDSYLKHVKEFGERDTSIDRINGNDDYKKSNCRWATCKEQSKNMRNNVFITYKGKTMIMSDWARELDTDINTFYARLRHGWNMDKIVNTPVKTKSK